MSIIFLRRDFSQALINEFANSTFLQQKIYNDAIIGVTQDERIVYNFYYMQTLLNYEYKKDAEYLKEEFGEDYEDDLMDYVHESVSITTYWAEFLHKENPKAPIFCYDDDFTFNILPNVELNCWAEFQEEKEEE
ncbi:hypothetical protein [Chryseobacterium sp. JK1]|uniref:hypothetical protein n=1 Tax=Chryseobacterium sp. JK1 TaxID=874294 RepID=UPI003D680734